MPSNYNIKHGHTQNSGPPSPTYASWKAMRQRCLNKNHRAYHRYGGAGITICPEWTEYMNFLLDMGERPEGTSLDRYPNQSGNYEPSNCRWATPTEQAINSKPRRAK